MAFFKNVFRARHILFSLVNQDLKNKYRNSFFGIGWSLLTPLGLVLIIGLVFSQVLKQPIKDFVPFLFSGLIPWLYLVQCADGGTAAFISGQGYIKQTQTPIEIFPIRVVLTSFVQLLYSLAAFFIMYLFISPENFNTNMFFVIISLPIWLLAGIGLATISAIINTYIRDYSHLQSLIIQGLFYATPIMYPVSLLEKSKYRWIYEWNPIHYLIEIIREPLLGKKMPDLSIWLSAVGFVFLILFIGVLSIGKIGRKITFRL
ncbi:ABC transporter permease [Aneurinibacillus tyrosinisolvens]|uniref:ABC transporter permease n=1 Tax=Aneurinibacillus tyrosinisolvens TaxID=1443435 RepID=UPI00069B5D87|nr:ABC transporter permease [Aneurinibacillus tyrosinisolvens]